MSKSSPRTSLQSRLSPTTRAFLRLARVTMGFASLGLMIMIIAWFVATLLFGATLRYPTLAGFVAGYLAYDMVHYYTHHAKPTTKLGLALRRLHLMLCKQAAAQKRD